MTMLSKKTSWLFICITTMMGMLTLLPSDIYIPALPLMQKDFSTTASQAQLTMSFFFLGAGISQLLAGPIADSYNGRHVSLVALSIFLVSSIACIFAPTMNILIACRFFQALSAGFVAVISRAAIVRTCNKTETTRIFLIMSPIIAISPGIAPIIGGYLTKFFGWQASFVFISIFSIMLLLLVLKFIDIPGGNKSNIHPIKIIKTYGKLFKNNSFNIYLFMRSGIDASYFAYITASPFIFNAMGYTMAEIGNFYFLIALSYILMTYVCKKMITPDNANQLMLIGLFISLIGIALMAILNVIGMHTVLAIIVPAAIMTAGYGFSGPLSWSEAMAQFPDDAGATSSLIGFCPLFASAIAAAVVNKLTGDSIIGLSVFLFILLGIIALALIGLIYLVRRKTSPFMAEI